MGQVVLHRRYPFQAVHSLEHHLERRHGHQYYLEIGFLPDAGWKLADQCVQSTVIDRLHAREIDVVDHATGEKIVNWIHSQLQQTQLGPFIVSVALQETRKNRFISAQTDLKYV